jgi:hypothetical protein
MRVEDGNAAPKFGPQTVSRKFRIEATCRRTLWPHHDDGARPLGNETSSASRPIS